MNRELILFDPEVQVSGSEWVILFFLIHENYVLYRKLHARNSAKTITVADPGYNTILTFYKSWLKDDKQKKINLAQEEIRCREEKLCARITKLQEKHRKQVKLCGKEYLGVSDHPLLNNIRNTTCYYCHRTISSRLHLQCNACAWIICPSCARCGCGYS